MVCRNSSANVCPSILLRVLESEEEEIKLRLLKSIDINYGSVEELASCRIIVQFSGPSH